MRKTQVIAEQRNKELDKKVLAFLKEHEDLVDARTIAYALGKYDTWNTVEMRLYALKAEGKVRSMRTETELFQVM